jgi:hypothetical protein
MSAAGQEAVMGMWLFGGVVVAVVLGLLALDWVMAGRVSRRIRSEPPQSLNADYEITLAELRRGENKSGT